MWAAGAAPPIAPRYLARPRRLHPGGCRKEQDMRHGVAGRKLNRTSSHRKAMLNNMVKSLFEHERIHTTVPKAKEARRLAEQIITLGKKGGLHNIRQAERVIHDRGLIQKISGELK